MAALARPLAGAWHLSTLAKGSAWIRPLPGGVPHDLGFGAAHDLAQLPPSKSHAQRMLLLAALLSGRHELCGIGTGLDVQATLRAVRSLGATVDESGDIVHVRGIAPGAAPLQARVHCAENGTLLRTLGVLVPALGGAVELDADEALRRRPMQPLFDAWQALHVARGTGWPLCTVAPPAPPVLPQRLDGRVTTQVATGLMLALALRGGGSMVVESPGSRDYLQVTAAVLRTFGFTVDVRVEGADLTIVIGGTATRDTVLEVPRDPSARCFVLALAALHGRAVSPVLAVAGAAEHPDAAADADFAKLRAPGDLVLAGIAARPDSVPALAVAAACRGGTTRMPGLAVLRGKESDRLDQLARGITACGARCHIEDEGLVVTGPLVAPQATVVVDCAPDHRIVMALALLGTVLPAGIRIAHAACVAKSWPSFWDWLARMARVDRAPA